MTEIAVERQLTPSQAKNAIRVAMNIKRPLFLWGPPGIGKSDIVKQIADESGREVIDVRLSLWEPSDIKGIPYFNTAKGGMEWAPPVELPRDPNSTAVLFLDELNSATPATQAAAYQLVLNRRVGTYVLPKGVSIIAAGNRDSDRGVTYKMPAPLANRFMHIELRADFDDWLSWSAKSLMNEQVVGYLCANKADLYGYDPKTSTKTFPTPRSWSMVSDVINAFDISTPGQRAASLSDSQEQLVTDLVGGCVGSGVALKFIAHRKLAHLLPSAEDIITGRATTLETREISVRYSLTISVCYELKRLYDAQDANFTKYADNFLKFMLDNYAAELVVVGIRMILNEYQMKLKVNEMPNFKAFTAKYGKHLKDSLSGN